MVLPFTIAYCDANSAEERLTDDHLLALIRFQEPVGGNPDPRSCPIPLPELGGTATAEVWLSPRPVQTGMVSGVGYAGNGEVLFLQLQSDEYAPDALQPLTAIAYRRLFAVARAQGYPHFLRIWNYLPNINQECGGLERYRAFCAGRRQVLDAVLAEVETRLPAASAIGFPASLAAPAEEEKAGEGGLRLYALAAREAGEQVENPRQVSAFHYPPEYGRRSPSFSRAVLKRWGNSCHHLYISGTASVVGHATRHDDLMAQLDETLVNLEALLTAASRRAATPLLPALLRVYVRPDSDPAPLRQRIVQTFGDAVAMVFLQADICRQELLIEIEGLAISAAD
jgi:chorismate lyase/3-hydroxybenzoate synthase